MERCDSYGGDVKVLGRCDSCHEGGIRNVCQLMEMCDCHVGGVKGFGEV